MTSIRFAAAMIMWTLTLVLSLNRDMAFGPLVGVLGAAFLMGLAAAAPIGPVNMMAIRRGVVEGWRHTLVCGLGSAFGDLLLFSLALVGGHYLMPDLFKAPFQMILAGIGIVVIFPLGVYFLTLTIKDSDRAYDTARRRWSEGPAPARLVTEGVKAAALTVFNPLTMIYWVGITSSWLPFAYSVLGNNASSWGILMAGTGLMTWFTALVVVVRFIPRRIDAIFFRLANAILGIILLGFASYCAVVLLRHFWH
jgi:threonine/homoserine/homoserine lactone efflux protein